MKFTQSHFWYNKNQRNGILFLILIIISLQAVYFFIDFTPHNNSSIDVSEIDAAQKQIDSIKNNKVNTKKVTIYPFNPNYINDFKAYQLGMCTTEIDKLLAFRKTGKFINSVREFQQITGVNDSLLNSISPYFKFPNWTQSKQQKTTAKHNTKITTTVKDLNTATAKQLEQINGIGNKLANRIITYRKLLQGFSYNYQLYEVYYLDKAVADRVLKQYKVIKKPKIQKLNINKATFKEILHLPYIDYPLTKKICNYKNEIGHYNQLSDLKKIDSFPIEKYDRITLYLLAD